MKPEKEPQVDRPAEEAKALKKARMQAARCSVLAQVALKSAEHTLTEHFGPAKFDADVTTEDIRAMAAVIFIELSRSTDITKLPTKLPEPEAPKEREPERRREPERDTRRQDPTADDPDDTASERDIPFDGADA